MVDSLLVNRKMGNGRLVSRKRMLLERLLKEGWSYLALMKDLDEGDRINSRDCKTVIHFLDVYSRSKAGTKECQRQLADDDYTWDEEETEEEEMAEVETEEEDWDPDADESDMDDIDDLLLSPCTVCRGDPGRTLYMEVLVGRTVGLMKELAGLHMYRYTLLRPGLKSYCKRARATLNGGVSVVQRLNNVRNVELAGKFKKKYNVLCELLSDIEKRDAVFEHRYGRER